MIQKEIISFFNLSVIIYGPEKELCVREIINEFTDKPFNGLEIIFLISGKGVDVKQNRALLSKNPFLNLTMLYFEQGKPSFSEAINTGMKYAKFESMLIMDNAGLITYQFLVCVTRFQLYYKNRYFLGIPMTSETRFSTDILMVLFLSKKYFVKVAGFNEKIFDPYLALRNLCNRLDLLGLKKMYLPFKTNLQLNNEQSINKQKKVVWKSFLYPSRIQGNEGEWGAFQFSEVWRYDKSKDIRDLKVFLEYFERYNIISNDIVNLKYQVIALIQVRNEERNLPDILVHLENYCDGVILLDDGSDDKSYESAQGANLLIKAKKNYKGYFDDLENRNLLLRLASFIKSEWFYFIDADERFDPRFDKIKEYITCQNTNVYKFCLVDIWDKPDTYRVDIPDGRKEGITTRARMFRNNGNLQIYSDREIHFPAVPYVHNMRTAQVLLLHYGNFSNAVRLRKLQLYLNQDPQQVKQGHSYGYLKDKVAVLKNVKQIDLTNFTE